MKVPVLFLLLHIAFMGGVASHAQTFSVTYNWPETSSGASCGTPVPPATQWPSTHNTVVFTSNNTPLGCIGTGETARINGADCVGLVNPNFGINSDNLRTAGKPATQTDVQNAPAVAWTLTACFGSFRLTDIASGLRRSGSGSSNQNITAGIFYRIGTGSWVQWGTDVFPITTSNSSPTPFSFNTTHAGGNAIIVPEGETIEMRLIPWSARDASATLRLRNLMTLQGEYTPGTLASPATSAASNISCSAFTANWQAVADANTYFLDLSTSPAFAPGTLLHEQLEVGDVTTYDLSALQGNTDYYYRVTAARRCNIMGMGATICATGVPGTATQVHTPDIAVAGLTTTAVQCTSLDIDWEDLPMSAVYDVDYSTDATFITNVQQLPGLTTSAGTLPNLLPATTYHYRVRARTAACTGGWQIANAATLPLPGTPMFNMPTATCSELTLSWGAISQASGYELEVYTDLAMSAPVLGSPFGVSSISHPIVGLTPGGTYYYRLKAIGTCGASVAATGQYTLPALPATDLDVHTVDVCLDNESPTITVVQTQSGVPYRLLRNGVPEGADQVGTGSSLTFYPAAGAGTHTYEVQVGSGSCIATLAQRATYTAYALPATVLNTQPLLAGELVSNSPVQATFSPAVGATALQLTLGDGRILSSDGASITTTFASGQPHTVLAEVTYGSCSEVVMYSFEVKKSEAIRIPNVFTPNGDNLNDRFEVPVVGLQQCSFSIFDRWGAPVLSQTSIAPMWNGQMNNSGADCPEGTYLYTLKLTLVTGETLERAGTITLIR